MILPRIHNIYIFRGARILKKVYKSLKLKLNAFTNLRLRHINSKILYSASFKPSPARRGQLEPGVSFWAFSWWWPLMGVPATDKPACRINFGGVGHVPIYLAGSGARPLYLKTLLCFTVLSFTLSSFTFTYIGRKSKGGIGGHSKANSLWCFPSKFSQLQNKSCLWSSL